MRSSLLLKSVLFACAILPAFSTHAQDAASAKTFLQSVYSRYYKNDPGVEIARPQARRYLHSSLIALLREDSRAVGPGEVGVLDGDPLCSCQDWDGIFNLKIDVREPKADRVEASVSFALSKNAKPQDRRSLMITLQLEKGAWRVWNVVDRSDAKAEFDLRSELQKEIASMHAKRTPKPILKQ
ncbi:MAG: DUF3828 domain-containing protein [Acidobacteria bacterium]|nr:DUF3828 domain-containing protein [Acidobacteriota bacterium]